MAKKKRRKKLSRKKRKRLIKKKKIRRLALRSLLLGTGIVVGILARPSLIKDPVKRAQVEDVRKQVLQANDEVQEKTLDTLIDGSQKAQQVFETVSNLTEDVTDKNPKEIVETTVINLTQEVKSLPQKQIEKIKLEFCQDIIEDMELTCKQDE